MDAVVLRFDAPLVSFGGVMVDHNNPTDRFPARSLLTGLFANALGWAHGDFDKLNELQSRLGYAARWDVRPQLLCDYQTVDLGLPHMTFEGWTTQGIPEHREGGPSARRTHQRERWYWANGVLTVAVGFRDGAPAVSEIETALRQPARPLFIGRKNCLPAAPLSRGVRSGTSLLSILQDEPASRRMTGSGPYEMEACWPAGDGDERQENGQRVVRVEDREWENQIHVGERVSIFGLICGVPTCT